MSLPMIPRQDLRGQLRRLRAIVTHCKAEPDSLYHPEYYEGQLNAFKAVALSYGLDLGE